ncbi:MAG: bifunctional sugar-1-phosphate nucleotidylyltransferase/acetyltransferase [Haloferacaceae archaeon]
MQTVVLAAGRGTRMGPLTDERPKPMLPVADRPLLAHVLDAAAAAGASRFVVVDGPGATGVEPYVGETYAGAPVTYVTQRERRGTADAVERAADALDDAPFVVLNGDVLYDPEGLARLYRECPAVGATRVAEPSEYGVLQPANPSAPHADRLVRGVVEKPADPPSNLVNAGAYAFPSAAREWLDVPVSDRGERELTDVLDRTCEAFDVRAVPFEEWLDVGRPWELLAANERALADLSRDLAGEVSPDAHLSGAVVVEEGATVERGVTIEGPALVRSGATVGPNAYVRGRTLLGEDVSVGHAVEIKNSVLMAGTNVNHLSYVGDSVLGRSVNLGAGTVVANLRHDGEPVGLTVKGRRRSTGRRKFGVVLGDEVATGVDTSLNAGVTLGTGVTTDPGETVRRDR